MHRVSLARWAALPVGAALGLWLGMRHPYTLAPLLPYTRAALPLVLVTLALCITPHRKDP
jgi:hypothetical protein